MQIDLSGTMEGDLLQWWRDNMPTLPSIYISHYHDYYAWILDCIRRGQSVDFSNLWPGFKSSYTEVKTIFFYEVLDLLDAELKRRAPVYSAARYFAFPEVE